MGQTLRYRWFGIGRMPEPLRPAPGAGEPLHFAEGVPVALRANGAAPGCGLSHGFYRSKSGAFFVTDERVVASVGRTPVIDVGFAAADPGGAARVRLEADGVYFRLDLARAIPEASGELSLHFREPLESALLARLPVTELGYRIEPDHARSLFRRRHRL